VLDSQRKYCKVPCVTVNTLAEATVLFSLSNYSADSALKCIVCRSAKEFDKSIIRQWASVKTFSRSRSTWNLITCSYCQVVFFIFVQWTSVTSLLSKDVSIFSVDKKGPQKLDTAYLFSIFHRNSSAGFRVVAWLQHLQCLDKKWPAKNIKARQIDKWQKFLDWAIKRCCPHLRSCNWEGHLKHQL